MEAVVPPSCYGLPAQDQCTACLSPPPASAEAGQQVLGTWGSGTYTSCPPPPLTHHMNKYYNTGCAAAVPKFSDAAAPLKPGPAPVLFVVVCRYWCHIHRPLPPPCGASSTAAGSQDCACAAECADWTCQAGERALAHILWIVHIESGIVMQNLSQVHTALS